MRPIGSAAADLGGLAGGRVCAFANAVPESEPTDGARTCDDVSAATDHRAAPVAAGAIFKLTMSSK